MSTNVRQQPRLWFYLAAGLVFAACIGILRSGLYAQNPTALTVGVACDLIVTIPALYYLCMVRNGRAAAITLLPVVVLCLSLTKLILPPAGQALLRPLLLLAGPLEPIGITVLVFRLRRRIRQSGDTPADEDAFDRFQRAVKALYGEHPLLDFLLAELAFMWYGTVGWGLRCVVPHGASAFTCYKKSGWTTIVFVLMFLILLEGSVVHLLIAKWNPAAAWLWTTLDLYAVIWLLGDYQALRLRPILLTSDLLCVRLGLRWTGTIPLQQIDSVMRVSATAEPVVSPHYVKIAAMSSPEFVITLREPVEFRGLLGRKRQVRTVGILADQRDLFRLLAEQINR